MSGGMIMDGDTSSGVAAEVLFGEQAVGHINGALRVAKKGKVLFDNTVGGSNNQTPVLDLTGVEMLYFVITNSDAAGSRNLTMDSFLDDGANNFDPNFQLAACAFGAVTRGTLGPYAGGLGTPALQFATPMALPTKARFTLATGATGARMTIIGR